MGTWDDRFVRKLELIVEALNKGPAGRGMSWNDRVLRLLDQIRLNVGATVQDTRVQEHAFGAPIPVPPQGSLWLSIAGVASSDAPLLVGNPGTTRTGALYVSEADSKPYRLDVYQGGVAGSTIDALLLPAGQTFVVADLSGTALTRGDTIAVEMSRVSGSGPSAFRRAVFNLEILE